MGASLSVVFRSPQEATQIHQTLDKYTPRHLSYLGHSERPFWRSNKRHLGIKYSDYYGAPKVFVYAVLRWIACNYGRRQRSFKIREAPNPFPQPVPYVQYDGFENWPVLAPDYPHVVTSSLQWCRVDALGLPLQLGRNYHLINDYPDTEKICYECQPHTPGFYNRLEETAGQLLEERLEPVRTALRGILPCLMTI